VRLLLDEMYPRRLAEQLRRDGHDVVAVVETPDLVGRPDAHVAQWALEQDRVVITENVIDYVTLEPDAHAGLLLVNARRWRRTPAGIPRLRAALAEWIEGTGADGRGGVNWL
jgi:Domain of unknown function (DUF5615)